MSEKAHTVREACRLLGVSKPTFYRIVKRGELSTINVSIRATRVLDSEITRFQKRKSSLA